MICEAGAPDIVAWPGPAQAATLSQGFKTAPAEQPPGTPKKPVTVSTG